jgi:HEAT repeat protein
MRTTPETHCMSEFRRPTLLGARAQHRAFTPRSLRWLSCLTGSAVLLATLVASSAAAGSSSQARRDFVMFGDPPIRLPEAEVRFHEGTLVLWLAALESPESDLRQQAQRTLAWAHAQGMEGTEAAVEPLLRNLVQHDRLVVRLTAAQALVALDARQAAQALFDRSQIDGLDMAQLIEPALGRWRFPPIIDVWRGRLSDQRVDRRRRLLAIHGLAVLEDEQAAKDLQHIASDKDQSADLRLSAATALGRIRHSGLETAARALLTRQTPPVLIDRLVAVRWLRFHESPEAQAVLVELTADEQSTVVASALERLLELDPERITGLAEPLLARGDVNVRRLVARALLACPSVESVHRLADLLADPIPSLRDDAREFLETLAQSPELRAEVIRQGERMLDDARWPVLEQCVVLIANLHVVSASDRLVELLSHDRPEVFVVAAWGLRRLDVEHTLVPALDIARQRKEMPPELSFFQPGQPGLDEQLAHLFEFFGQRRFHPADQFLRTFIEKDRTIPYSRSAAIWALGYLHEGQPPAELAKLLEGRLSDLDLLNPEDFRVRRFSAISLGRMNASEALPTLEKFNEPWGIHSTVGYACAWSIERLTGRPFPPVPTPIDYHTGFFLEPLDEPEPR